MTRRAAKIDGNQRKIVGALKDHGASVRFIGHPLDLLVGFRGYNYLFELKREGWKGPQGKVQRATWEQQQRFMAEWEGQADVVTMFEQAVEIMEGER